MGFMVLLFGVGPRCERDCEPGMGRVRQGGAGGGGGTKGIAVPVQRARSPCC